MVERGANRCIITTRLNSIDDITTNIRLLRASFVRPVGPGAVRPGSLFFWFGVSRLGGGIFWFPFLYYTCRAPFGGLGCVFLFELGAFFLFTSCVQKPIFGGGFGFLSRRRSSWFITPRAVFSGYCVSEWFFVVRAKTGVLFLPPPRPRSPPRSPFPVLPVRLLMTLYLLILYLTITNYCCCCCLLAYFTVLLPPFVCFA